MDNSEDPWHWHILPSDWQWSCRSQFYRLRSVAARIRTTKHSAFGANGVTHCATAAVKFLIDPKPPLEINSSWLKARRIRNLQKKKVYFYGHVTITDEGLQIFTYAWHSWTLNSEGSLAYHNYCDTRHQFLIVISDDPWHANLFPSV